MTELVCDKCGRTFAYPSLLAKHAGRKTPCDKVNTLDNKCSHCGREFSTRGNAKKHEGRCKSANAVESRIKRLQQEVESLRAAAGQTVNIVNNNITNNITNNVAIKINSYDSPSYDKITLSVAEIRQPLPAGVIYFRKLYLDESIPENASIELVTENALKIRVHDGANWNTLIADCARGALELAMARARKVPYNIRQRITLAELATMTEAERYKLHHECGDLVKDRVVDTAISALLSGRIPVDTP